MTELTGLKNLENRLRRVDEAIHIKNAIRKALEGSETDPEKEKTIPTIATEIGHPTHIVHWYLTSMRKYSIASETANRDGQYFKWALIPITVD
ncbi:MAG: hypothetical protein ACXACU_01335 [Candidatus Hodarchaeales archaeon]|jgi:hypothetical protein